MIRIASKNIILLTMLAMHLASAHSQGITEDDPLYYKKRKNRIEGIYNRPLNFLVNPDDRNSNFIFIGYTLGKFYFVKDINEVLNVHAAHDADLIGRSSANDLSYKYRLDAALRKPNDGLAWPLKDVIWHLAQLNPYNLGIFGYDDGVYVPISILNRSFVNDSTLRVHLTVKVPTKNIRYRLLAADGRLLATSHWVEITVNGKTFVRPGQLIVVPVHSISGRCVLELQGINRDTMAPMADNFTILALP